MSAFDRTAIAPTFELLKKMSPDFDVIIVGSGPAGVSAALPIVEAGFNVLMVDGGIQVSTLDTDKSFLASRNQDISQWEWLIGKNFSSLQAQSNTSPKLKVPSVNQIFKNFKKTNKISSTNFVALGSLSSGGLSNVWGCGIACLSKSEFNHFPFHYESLRKSYQKVIKRIGASGQNNDDLVDYFGLDEWAQEPIKLDPIQSHIFKNYTSNQGKLAKAGFNLGRSRVAALSQDYAGRSGCCLCSNCLWGCNTKTLYSASIDLKYLKKFKNFRHQPGYIVRNLKNQKGFWSIQGQQFIKNDNFSISAKKVILAAGTLATTRLAFSLLNITDPVRLQSNPTGAFLLWVPKFLGSPKTNSFGLGQLSFNISGLSGVRAFGSTFSTTGILVSDFATHLPISRRFGIDILSNLLGSCVVGNVFLPGEHSSVYTQLQADGSLTVLGEDNPEISLIMKKIAKTIRFAFKLSGSIMLPGSFKIGVQGSDAHYAGTLPMSISRQKGKTDPSGELYGCEGIYIVDGACLPSLSEKPHTLTIMANADRIGQLIATS